MSIQSNVNTGITLAGLAMSEYWKTPKGKSEVEGRQLGQDIHETQKTRDNVKSEIKKQRAIESNEPEGGFTVAEQAEHKEKNKILQEQWVAVDKKMKELRTKTTEYAANNPSSKTAKDFYKKQASNAVAKAVKADAENQAERQDVLGDPIDMDDEAAAPKTNLSPMMQQAQQAGAQVQDKYDTYKHINEGLVNKGQSGGWTPEDIAIMRRGGI